MMYAIKGMKEIREEMMSGGRNTVDAVRDDDGGSGMMAEWWARVRKRHDNGSDGAGNSGNESWAPWRQRSRPDHAGSHYLAVIYQGKGMHLYLALGVQ